MTIGLSGSLEDFRVLAGCREVLCEALGLQHDEVELSMGMSGDNEEAIRHGATNIRVGSTIFGARSYPPGHPSHVPEAPAGPAAGGGA